MFRHLAFVPLLFTLAAFAQQPPPYLTTSGLRRSSPSWNSNVSANVSMKLR
ncbi:MAG TPA: hypothetical protein VHW00_19900 [Thermoanaerobaculia bacterium]|nr:hypothetical protein [Thermoanaerobaculia bacterium]